MYVRDLDGNEYPLQATVTNDMDLNGNHSFSCTIIPTKVNEVFIADLAEMWIVVDHEEVEHKIIYCKRKGEGTRQSVEIKGIPLFFDEFDTTRIYDEYDAHMTATEFFDLVFGGSSYSYVLVDSFYAIQWEGLGKGATRLAMFKDGLNRYGAEFRIVGNTVYLESLIGRDTSFMYRYKLNASNITLENDGHAYYTYAKGFGDFAEGEEVNAKLIREYTSPLASIIGVRHAPPVYDGRVTQSDTMDERLKTLVDESLKISVSANIHDLRKQGYALAQPELGDRVFLIDERIGLDDEVRVTNISVTKDWNGDVLDLTLTMGSPGLVRRYQSNLDTSVQRITDLFNGNVVVPYNALPSATKTATKALQSAQTELEFNNGIIGRDPNNPNNLVLFTSAGIGISTDGGSTFKEAITKDGFVLSAGAIGQLSANNVKIGAATVYENGYDPSKIEVGGRNLAKNTAFKTTDGWTPRTGSTLSVTSRTETINELLALNTAAVAGNPVGFRSASAEGWQMFAGQVYTVSFFIRKSNIYDLDYIYLMHSDGSGNEGQPTVNLGDFDKVTFGGYAYYKVSFQVTPLRDDPNMGILIAGRADTDGHTFFYINQLKVEEGNKQTPHTEAPEDIADRTIQKNINYNGWEFDGANGVTISRTDGLVRVLESATDGIKIQNRPSTTGSWVDVLYMDTSGNLHVVGDIEGGSVKSNTTIDVTTDAKIGRKLTLNYDPSNASTVEFLDSLGAVVGQLYKHPTIDGLTVRGKNLELMCDSRQKVFLGYEQETYYNSTQTGDWDVGWYTKRGEEGVCGIGTTIDTGKSGLVIGTQVQFRLKKDSTYNLDPAYITLISSSSVLSNSEGLKTSDLTRDGFWLYIENQTAGTRYWRGKYRV